LSSAAAISSPGASRAQAEEAFSRLGIPGSRHEEWAYTDAKLFLEPGAPASEEAVAALAWEHSLPEAWQVLVFAGGRFRPDLSRLASAFQGVEVAPLSASVDSDPALCPGELDPIDRAFFLANRARWTDGLFLRIQEDTVLPGPVQILDIGSANSWLRHLVLARRGARGTVVEVRASPDGAAVSSLSVLEASLEDGADLSLANLQAGGDKARSWTGLAARLGRGAQLVSRQFLVAGELSRSESFVDLCGSGARAELAGLSAVSGERRADVLTVVRHAVPETSSEQLFQALAGGRAVVEAKVEAVRRRGQMRGQVLLGPINPGQQAGLLGARQILKSGHGAARDDERVARGDGETVGDHCEQVVHGEQPARLDFSKHRERKRRVCDREGILHARAQYLVVKRCSRQRRLSIAG